MISRRRTWPFQACKSRIGALAVLMLTTIIACGLCAMPARAHSIAGSDSGRFMIYAGGALIGVETFEISPCEAKCTVEFDVGGRGSRAEAVLELSAESGASAYTLDAGPGGRLSVSFENNTANLSLPGMARSFQLGVPRVVMDNNVFCHYQVLIGMYDLERGGVQTFNALVPSGITVAPFTVERIENSDKAAACPIPLVEYRVIVANAIGISVLVDEDGRMMQLENMGQGILAVREGFEEAIKRASQTPNGKPDAEAEAEVEAGPAVGRRFVEREFTVKGEEATLSGTLTLPSGASSPCPAVILISGSGPQDRDGNTPPSYVTNIFRTIAHRLADVGVAVLRYDERGVGASTGDHASADLYDLIGDVNAMIVYLKQLPEIDRERIALLGHSEGAYIAPYLASDNPAIAGCILLAGASVPLDELMIEQLEYQADFEELDEPTRAMIRSLMPAVQQFIQDAKDGKDSSVIPGNLEWLRQHMELNPIANIQKVKSPILIVQGEKDLKVMPYHADVLAQAARESGNADVAVVHLANTTHEFLQFPYNNPNFDPMDPAVVVDELFDTLQEWSKRVLIRSSH